MDLNRYKKEIGFLLVVPEHDRCQEADDRDDDKTESDLFLVSVKVHAV